MAYQCHRLRLFLPLLVCFLAMFANRSQAQGNLLTNPSFESGGFSGWSVAGTSSNFGVNVSGFQITGAYWPTTVVVHSGTYAGYALVCNTCSGGDPHQYLELTQSFTAVPGNVYTVSFWLGNGSTTAFYNASYVMLNGSALNLTTFSVINPGYQLMSGSFIATQANYTIKFHLDGSGSGAGGLSFDDFSVTQTGGPATNGGYLYETYSNNRIAPYQINTSNGTLVEGVGAPFLTGSEPNTATTAGSLTYVADQGSSQISAYVTNQTTGAMTPVSGSPYSAGITPVGIAIDRSLHYLYAVGSDHNNNGVIAAWSYNPVTGVLTSVAGSPFPAGGTPSAIAFSRNGQNVYVTDHYSGDLLAYSVNTMTGALTQIAGSPYRTGSYPLAVATDIAGNFVYVADAGDDTISAFKIGSNGTLTAVPGSPFATAHGPWSLAFDSAQHFLYVANLRANAISTYSINPLTGALTQLSGSPMHVGYTPSPIVTSHNFLYVNLPGTGLFGYQINPTTGAITRLPGFPTLGSGLTLTTAGTSGGN